MLRGIVGGIFGGLLGAGAWTLATAISGTQSGLGLWLVGLLTGVGVALGMKREGSARAGWAAIAVALGAIGAGSVAGGAWASTENTHANAPPIINEAGALAHLERAIQKEWAEQGRVLTVGEGRAVDAEVRAESARQWSRMSNSERSVFMQTAAEQARESGAGRGAFAGLTSRAVLLNGLWFALALATAFKVAASAQPARPEQVKTPRARENLPETDDLSSVSWGRRPRHEERRRAA